MKKHQRLNLSSTLYRVSPKSNRSVSPSFVNDSIKNNTISVCCPNCKYLFRVNKEEHRNKKTGKKNADKQRSKWAELKTDIKNFQKSVSKNSRNSNSISKNSQTIEVQTQPYLMGQYKKSTKRQNLLFHDRRQAITDRITEKLFNKSLNWDIDEKTPIFTDRKYEQYSGISERQSDLSRSRNNATLKSISKGSQFPSRMAYMQGNSDISHRNSTINRSMVGALASKAQTKHSQLSTRKLRPSSKAIDSVTQNKLPQKSIDLLQKIHLSEQIGQILQYHMNLPPQLSLPSYCKMLVYDLKARNQWVKAKGDQGDIGDMGEEDLPRFSGGRAG